MSLNPLIEQLQSLQVCVFIRLHSLSARKGVEMFNIRVHFYGDFENLPRRVCQSLEMHLRQVVSNDWQIFTSQTLTNTETLFKLCSAKCSFWASIIDMVNTHYLRLTEFWASIMILDIWYFRLSHESRVTKSPTVLSCFGLCYFGLTLFSC